MKIKKLNKNIRTFKETYIFLQEKINEMNNEKYKIEASKHVRFSHSKNISYSMFDFSFIKKTYKQDIEEFELSSKDKKSHSFFSIYFNIIFDYTDENIEIFKSIGKEIEEFFGFDVSTSNSYIPAYNLYNISRLQQGKEYENLGEFRFETKTSLSYDINYSLLLKTNEELNKENLLYMIQNFPRKLNTSSNMKLAKESLFGTVNSKLYKELISSLEKENKIIVKRTPKLIIKELELNNNYNDDNINTKLQIMQKLESKGKLKLIEGITNGSNKYVYELYNFHLFPHLKTYLILNIDTDEFYLKIDYFAMKYGKNIMQDMGVWQDFKNSLNNKLNKKIKVIEDFLDIKINNTLIPLKYMENSTGQSIFESKSFDIELN
jgi:hypothetical protein